MSYQVSRIILNSVPRLNFNQLLQANSGSVYKPVLFRLYVFHSFFAHPTGVGEFGQYHHRGTSRQMVYSDAQREWKNETRTKKVRIIFVSSYRTNQLVFEKSDVKF